MYRNISFLLQSALRAESSIENTTCESKKVTFLIALNHVLILPDYRSRRELSGSVLKIENGALGVELWPFY